MKQRIESIDILRGVAMVIMALDHTRMYLGAGSSTPLWFLTRWITNPFAPVFVFLTGTGAFLYGTRSTIPQVSRFLLTRGLWLILIECTVVTFGRTFDVAFGRIILQVIWAIGISMLCLSALVYLPRRLILAIGLILAVGHHALDSITAQGSSLTDIIWYALHQPAVVALSPDFVLLFKYPVLPWIGLMSLGYVCGELFKQGYDSARRKRWLIGLGVASIVLFVVLRTIQVHFAWGHRAVHDSLLSTVLEFLNARKYPPSVLFLLIAMGPSLIFLAYIEKVKNRVTDFLMVFGRVPFFFYILHIYLIHSLTFLGLAYAGRSLSENILTLQAFQTESPTTFGFSLGVVYLVWILVVAALYPPCKWYGRYKASHREKWWLSYL